MTDQGILHLCDALKHVNCKLAQLNLSFNSIIDQGALHLYALNNKHLMIMVPRRTVNFVSRDEVEGNIEIAREAKFTVPQGTSH